MEKVNVFNGWLDVEVYEGKTEYFLNALNRLEEDFINYLEYVPLRKNNLDVSSQRLADFIIKIFPLQTIGFYVITLGEGMKKYIKNVSNMLDSGADIRVLKKISDCARATKYASD